MKMAVFKLAFSLFAPLRLHFRRLEWFACLPALLILAVPAGAAEVNIYSNRQPFLIQPMLDKFTAETGIAVNSLFAEKGLTERVKAEGLNSPVDVLLTTDIARLTEAVEAGITQPVDSPALISAIPESLRDPARNWFALTLRARVIYAANERVKDSEVTTYEGLTAPKWKGRICSRSGNSDYNIALLASQIAHHGETEAAKWLMGVKANLARKPQGDDRAQIRAVAQGECDIALGNTYYMAVMLADPEQAEFARAVHIVFPNQPGTPFPSGTHVNVSGMAMAKHAPNREAAQKLMEFLASPEAQKMYANINNEYPVRSGVESSELLQSWGEFKSDELPLQEIAKFRKRALEIVYETGFDQ